MKRPVSNGSNGKKKKHLPTNDTLTMNIPAIIPTEMTASFHPGRPGGAAYATAAYWGGDVLGGTGLPTGDDGVRTGGVFLGGGGMVGTPLV